MAGILFYVTAVDDYLPWTSTMNSDLPEFPLGGDVGATSSAGALTPTLIRNDPLVYTESIAVTSAGVLYMRLYQGQQWPNTAGANLTINLPGYGTFTVAWNGAAFRYELAGQGALYSSMSANTPEWFTVTVDLA
jgi:hypothetical protein